MESRPRAADLHRLLEPDPRRRAAAAAFGPDQALPELSRRDDRSRHRGESGQRHLHVGRRCPAAEQHLELRSRPLRAPPGVVLLPAVAARPASWPRRPCHPHLRGRRRDPLHHLPRSARRRLPEVPGHGQPGVAALHHLPPAEAAGPRPPTRPRRRRWSGVQLPTQISRERATNLANLALRGLPHDPRRADGREPVAVHRQAAEPLLLHQRGLPLGRGGRHRGLDRRRAPAAGSAPRRLGGNQRVDIGRQVRKPSAHHEPVGEVLPRGGAGMGGTGSGRRDRRLSGVPRPALGDPPGRRRRPTPRASSTGSAEWTATARRSPR